MRIGRGRLQFGVELHADEPDGLIFDDFRQNAIRESPEKRRPHALESVLVGVLTSSRVAVIAPKLVARHRPRNPCRA